MAILDTHKFITTLTDAGLKEEQAQIISDGINNIEKADGLAKSADVAELKGILKVLMALNVGVAIGIVGLYLS